MGTPLSTSQTDSINRTDVWVSSTPFSVNVQSAASTNAFLLTATGTTPTLTLGPFATSADTDYSFNTQLDGQYVLARLVNTSDSNNDRNLGGRTLLVGVVPEPSSFSLATVGLIAIIFRLRGSRKRYVR